MVDVPTYYRMHRKAASPPSRIKPRFDPWPAYYSREDTPDDKMIVLLPPSLYGFNLQEKQWSTYHPLPPGT